MIQTRVDTTRTRLNRCPKRLNRPYPLPASNPIDASVSRRCLLARDVERRIGHGLENIDTHRARPGMDHAEAGFPVWARRARGSAESAVPPPGRTTIRLAPRIAAKGGDRTVGRLRRGGGGQTP